MSEIAKRIQGRLDQLGKSASAASLEAGLGRSGLQDILTGKSQNPRLDTLRKLTGPLECSLADLTSDEPRQTPVALSAGPATGNELPGMAPAQIIDIALAAGAHTSAQIIAALSAAGLVIVPKGTEVKPAGVDANAIDDPVAYIRAIVTKHQITPTALAKNIGAAASSLNRVMAGKTGISARTLRKIKEWDREQS